LRFSKDAGKNSPMGHIGQIGRMRRIAERWPAFPEYGVASPPSQSTAWQARLPRVRRGKPAFPEYGVARRREMANDRWARWDDERAYLDECLTSSHGWEHRADALAGDRSQNGIRSSAKLRNGGSVALLRLCDELQLDIIGALSRLVTCAL
jgi:hypothetical protein